MSKIKSCLDNLDLKAFQKSMVKFKGNFIRTRNEMMTKPDDLRCISKMFEIVHFDGERFDSVTIIQEFLHEKPHWRYIIYT